MFWAVRDSIEWANNCSPYEVENTLTRDRAGRSLFPRPFFFFCRSLHPFHFLCKFSHTQQWVSRYSIFHHPSSNLLSNLSPLVLYSIIEIYFVNADWFLGFNEAFSWQCPSIHEGEQIWKLLWAQDCCWCQYEHLPVSCK